MGGGFTGLWTAYQISGLRPDLRVVVLEQDICGGGPSGRNGGFASGWWDELDGLVALYGEDAAVRICRAISDAITGIGDFCATEGVDAWFNRAGYVFAATTEAQMEVREHMVKAARDVGAAEEMVALDPTEVGARCDSPRFRAGALMRDAASVQPALLARGLRAACLRRGVVIHEDTTVNGIRDGRMCEILTSSGVIRAPHVVMAVNAWASAWPRLRRRLVAWSSYMVLTEPAPDLLREINWTGGELVSDLRTSIRYFRTTRDGRIAFGGGGGRARSRIDDSFTSDSRAVAEVAEGFRRLFPSFAQVPIVDAWGGPIDVSTTHLPWFGTLPSGNVHAALGYTGNGVAPSHLAGRVLADLVLARDTDLTRLALVNAPLRQFPVEPFRSLGAAVVRRAIIAKDTAEERGERANPLASAIAHLPRRMGYLLGP